MLGRDSVLRQLRQLQPFVRSRYHAEDLALFGSLARDEHTEESDVDLLVTFGVGATLLDLVGLALYLEEQLGARVDVVPRRKLRSEIRAQVLAEAIAL